MTVRIVVSAFGAKVFPIDIPHRRSIELRQEDVDGQACCIIFSLLIPNLSWCWVND